MRKLNFMILLASLILWSANIPAKEKKEAMIYCKIGSPQAKKTDTKQIGKVVDELEWRHGLWYAKGNKTPFAGKILKCYDNGQKKDERNYNAGKAEGIHASWYSDGQKFHKENYKAGKREGIRTFWYSDGKKNLEGNWKAGKKEGVHITWQFDGKKYHERNYKTGIEVSCKTSLLHLIDSGTCDPFR